MRAFIAIFFAFAFALMLFISLQPQLPDELGFLKGGDPAASHAPAVSLAPPQHGGLMESEYDGWRIIQQGTVVELVKTMALVDGAAGPSPIIGILCHTGKLDMRIDTGERTSGAKAARVQVNGGRAQDWSKGAENNIFPKQPASLLKQLMTSSKPVRFTFDIATSGARSAELEPRGLTALVAAFPPSCQPL